jgi:hypothetical protein
MERERLSDGREFPEFTRTTEIVLRRLLSMCGSSATKRSSSMRCAAAPGVIRDGSFARAASKMGSTHPACTKGLTTRSAVRSARLAGERNV